MLSPKPRVVLVTGAANGIGWATARRFAAAGDRVALADIDGGAAQHRAGVLEGDGHCAIAADLGDPASAEAMVAAVLARYGRIDVLVNNAGMIDAQATPAVDVDIAAFRRLLAVNLQGGYVASCAAAAAMRQYGGSIVNLASGAGLVAIPFRNGYGASKGAVIAMTRALAGAWPGVRVNAVAPGYIRTEMVDSLARGGKINLARVERRIPLGRLGESREMAEVIHFLAGPDSACVNGAIWVADGGYLAFGGTGDAARPGGHVPEVAAGRQVGVLVGNNLERIGAIAVRLEAGGMRVVRVAADAATVGRDIGAVVAQEGRLDALVTGIDAPAARADASGVAFMERIDAMLTATFVACQAAGRAMLAQGWGAIVNLTGTPAGRPVAEDAAAAGVAMLSRNLACEWAAGGVRVNTLTHAGGDVGGVVAFLAGPAASYVTGSVLAAEG